MTPTGDNSCKDSNRRLHKINMKAYSLMEHEIKIFKFTHRNNNQFCSCSFLQQTKPRTVPQCHQTEEKAARWCDKTVGNIRRTAGHNLQRYHVLRDKEKSLERASSNRRKSRQHNRRETRLGEQPMAFLPWWRTEAIQRLIESRVSSKISNQSTCQISGLFCCLLVLLILYLHTLHWGH